MNTKKTNQLSLAYSPCPNDTFIFHALAHDCINRHGIDYSIHLEDVESLNQKAEKGIHDISKLSFAAIGNLQDHYGLLRVGAALGRGCGPILVARPGQSIDDIKTASIAIPGFLTTASLLLDLWAGQETKKAALSFESIMPALQRKDFDFGVIIHEGRFTYQKYGLIPIIDLGQWWEETTGLPIPLGGIAIHRRFSVDIARKVEEAISQSLSYAFKHPEASKAYIKTYAQELDDAIIRQHIGLYVNDFTHHIGPEAETAIDVLFSHARKQNLMKDSKAPLFFA